jgi:hypothetical protein
MAATRAGLFNVSFTLCLEPAGKTIDMEAMRARELNLTSTLSDFIIADCAVHFEGC